MLRKTEAIVLKTLPFSEADLIVTFITRDYGLLKTFAKSPRKTKSRFGSSLEPLTYSLISFWGREDANLPRLTQSDIIRPFQTIRERLGHFIKTMEIAEITSDMLPDRETNSGIFTLLLHVLSRIEKNCVDNGLDDLSFILYKIRFLEMAGYGPRLSGCGRCNKSDAGSGYNFYVSHGSILCEECALGSRSYTRLSPGAVRLYGTLRNWEITKIDRIRPSKTMVAELAGLLDEYLCYTLTRPLKTKALTLG